MLNLLYPISYLLCLTGLILWFYFKDSRSVSRKMSSLFLISFFVYLFALAFAEATFSFKLLILFRDLLILGVVSQLFNYVRGNPLVVLVAAIAFYGLIQFAGFSMLYHTFPEVKKSSAELNDPFELLVETKNGQIPKAYERLIAKYNLQVEPAFQPADPSLSRLDEFLAIGIPDDAERFTKKILKELIRIRGTQFVEYNEVIQLEILQDQPVQHTVGAKHVNDPLVAQQWGWDAIQGDRLHAFLQSSSLTPKKRVLIAIVDSGVDAAHEDLQDQFRSAKPAYDTDPLGHGTHCAGIAAAVSNNGKGVASLVPHSAFLRVTSIKVINALGIGDQRTTVQGIIQAADMGADVISLSLGSPSSDLHQRAYNEAVKYANGKGAIVVAAAGNSNKQADRYSPANAEGIIVVSAIGSDLRKASFSNTVGNMKYSIAAPGVHIMSTYPGMQYKTLDGTSMATPMVAGLIGVLKAFRPEMTTQDIYAILKDTGKSLPDGKATGKMIQAADALERVID